MDGVAHCSHQDPDYYQGNDGDEGDDSDEGDDGDGGDDIYIMMKCLSVCNEKSSPPP